MMQLKRCLSLLLLLPVVSAQGLWAKSDFDHQHAIFNALLSRHVDTDGFVDYRGFQSEQELLTAYQQQLDAVTPTQLQSWSQQQQLAFWINAYNVFTIQAILDHYPIERSGAIAGLFGPSNSILQIKGVWTDLEWQAASQTVTLDQIEHKILRVEYHEPRIHFAIVCASISCPKLRNEAYTAAQLDAQLQQQLQGFITDADKGFAIDTKRKRVRLSKIFDWFAEDFEVAENDATLFQRRSDNKAAVLRYLVRHVMTAEAREFLLTDDYKVRYLDYDWNLNEKE